MAVEFLYQHQMESPVADEPDTSDEDDLMDFSINNFDPCHFIHFVDDQLGRMLKSPFRR